MLSVFNEMGNEFLNITENNFILQITEKTVSF